LKQRVKTENTTRKLIKEIEKIYTSPWKSLLVATKGSSAASVPKTRKRPADTTFDLCIKVIIPNKYIYRERGRERVVLWCIVMHSGGGVLDAYFKLDMTDLNRSI
jgi:hypothetical protein